MTELEYVVLYLYYTSNQNIQSKAKTILLKFLNVLDSLLEYKSSPDYYCYGESHQSVVDLIHAFDWKNVFSIT